jgi:hypothetical protein
MATACSGARRPVLLLTVRELRHTARMLSGVNKAKGEIMEALRNATSEENGTKNLSPLISFWVHAETVG